MAKAKCSLGVHGATGRMGMRIIQLIAEDPEAVLGCALERPGHPRLGEDAGIVAGVGILEVPLTALGDGTGKVDAMIDFSHPAASLELAGYCERIKLPLVVGTTGFDADQRRRLMAVASTIPLMVSPNMSRAVNLLMRLVAETARALGSVADIEVIERHHRLKKDSPSGTALRLAEIAGEAAGISRLVHGREGQVGERPHAEIGIHAIRAGDEPGEHTVVFGLKGESIELRHRALNRDGFVKGAIDAAKYLAGSPPGQYTMADVIEGKRP